MRIERKDVTGLRMLVMNQHHRKASHSAFTLVELLTVIVIVALLFTLVILGIKSMRERSQGVSCLSNLRQIGAATALYAAEHQNELPYYHYVTATGNTGSGAVLGTWFYNLAPYLSVPRAEVNDPDVGSTERTLLGTPDQPITKPCIFTCPGHRKTESDQTWKPQPMTFPTRTPVSYAPALTLGSALASRGQGYAHPSGVTIYPVRLNNIESPGKKIWLMDSPLPHYLNASAPRWQPSEVYADNFPRQGFTRHDNGGNALFYDGHVEWLPLTTFTEYPLGIDRALTRYFHPFRDASLD